MSITFAQLRERLQWFRWYDGQRRFDLWGDDGKEIIPLDMLDFTINEALMEWAKESAIDKDVWDVELTTDQRRYGMPDDCLIITDARVEYDDSTGFDGYKVDLVNKENLISVTDDTSPDSDRPERMFVWHNEFELDPIPDDDYTFRIWGYHFPTTLSNDTDIPDPLELYHRTIYLKCKVFVAEFVGDPRKAEFEFDYDKALGRDKNFDKRRHNKLMVMKHNEITT